MIPRIISGLLILAAIILLLNYYRFPLYNYEVNQYDDKQRIENLANKRIIAKLESQIDSCNKEKVELLVKIRSNLVKDKMVQKSEVS